MRRAARLGDGFHFSSTSPAALQDRIAVLEPHLREAGRAGLPITGRVNVRFAERPASGYVIAGTPDEMLAEVRAYQDQGIEELAFSFGETDAERARNAIERFDGEVLAALR